MGLNAFPGSPLFCQYGANYGLVGILTNQDSGNNAGDQKDNKTDYLKSSKFCPSQ